MEKIFSKVAHPHEAVHVNSATWYVNALFVLALTCPPAVSAMAVVILGFADPAAALIGRRFGRLRLVNGRSLEGSATFWVVGTLAAWAVLSIFHREIPMGAALWMSVAGALFGALAELFSRRIDDNLSIPLASAAGASLMTLLLSMIGG
jgi:dolichol kinase